MGNNQTSFVWVLVEGANPASVTLTWICKSHPKNLDVFAARPNNNKNSTNTNNSNSNINTNVRWHQISVRPRSHPPPKTRPCRPLDKLLHKAPRKAPRKAPVATPRTCRPGPRRCWSCSVSWSQCCSSSSSSSASKTVADPLIRVFRADNSLSD